MLYSMILLFYPLFFDFLTANMLRNYVKGHIFLAVCKERGAILPLVYSCSDTYLNNLL